MQANAKTSVKLEQGKVVMLQVKTHKCRCKESICEPDWGH